MVSMCKTESDGIVLEYRGYALLSPSTWLVVDSRDVRGEAFSSGAGRGGARMKLCRAGR